MTQIRLARTQAVDATNVAVQKNSATVDSSSERAILSFTQLANVEEDDTLVDLN